MPVLDYVGEVYRYFRQEFQGYSCSESADAHIYSTYRAMAAVLTPLSLLISAITGVESSTPRLVLKKLGKYYHENNVMLPCDCDM